jgi:hypothetical protein
MLLLVLLFAEEQQQAVTRRRPPAPPPPPCAAHRKGEHTYLSLAELKDPPTTYSRVSAQLEMGIPAVRALGGVRSANLVVIHFFRYTSTRKIFLV